MTKNYANEHPKNKKKNQDKNIKVAGTADFYLKNIIRDTDSRAHKKLKKIKPLYLKGRELATDFKKKT